MQTYLSSHTSSHAFPGFNSVYHITDLPSFVSGRYISFLDPHGSNLPIDPGDTGAQYDLGSAEVKAARDQFAVYNVWDCEVFSKTDYNGTLFRFPLRDAQSQIGDSGRFGASAI